MRRTIRPSYARKGLVFAMILGLLGCLTFRLRSSAFDKPAKPDGATAQAGRDSSGQKDLDKNKCRRCAPPGDQSIYVPLVDLPEAKGGELVLNSRSVKDVTVTPVFYKRSGDVVVGRPVIVRPAEIRYVDVKSLIPSQRRHEDDWGGLSLSFYGAPREIWSQFRFTGINGGGSADEFFVVPNEQRAEEQEAALWMPRRSRAVIALGNRTEVPTAVSVDFGDGQPRDVQLPPHATEIVRREHPGESGVESIKLNINGAPGSVVPAGIIESRDGSFNSAIRFYDPKGAKQANLFANGLRLADVTPHLVLRNTTASPITAQPKFIPQGGVADAPVLLPEVNLGANETKELDLTELSRAAQDRDELSVVSAEVSTTSAPGCIIGSLYAVNNATGASYDVPLRDSGPVRSMTGAYPWEITNDFRTVVYVTNITDQEAEFVAQINYEGGKFVMAPRKLKAGETAAFDMLEMRDKHIQDSSGHGLPKGVSIGQFAWAMRGTSGGRVVLIGRAEVVSRSRKVSTSYSCPQDCGLYYEINIDPFPAPEFIGDTGTGTVWETGYSNVGYSIGPYQAGADWSVDNPVATFDPSSGASTTVTGMAVGDATLIAFAGWQDTYGFDGLNCYYYSSQPILAGGDMEIKPTISGPTTEWWFNGLTPTGYSTQITLSTTCSATSWQWNVTSGSGKVTLGSNGSCSITVTSAAPSSTQNDVSITVTVGGITSSPHHITVRAPTSLQAGTVSHTVDPVFGYGSFIGYTIRDQFSTQLPSGVAVNEQWSTGVVADFSGMDWRRGPEGGFETSSTAAFFDHIGGETSDKTPTPTVPHSPLGSTKVYHWGQQWFVGSSTVGSGRRVQSNTLQKYTDHATHENIVSPNP